MAALRNYFSGNTITQDCLDQPNALLQLRLLPANWHSVESVPANVVVARMNSGFTPNRHTACSVSLLMILKVHSFV